MNEHAAFILGSCAGMWFASALVDAQSRKWARFAGNLGLSLAFFAFHIWVFR